MPVRNMGVYALSCLRLPNVWSLFAGIVALLLVAPAWAEDNERSEKLPPAVDREVDFARDVLPIFQNSCHKCHGADKQEGGLRLHKRRNALTGGDSGASIRLGQSADSLLIRYVSGIDPDQIMPPEGEGARLTVLQVGILRKWIDQGAVWGDQPRTTDRAETHWAYQPIRRPELPQLPVEQDWSQSPIDAFVLKTLNDKGIAPSGPADRSTLIRRLSLDLLGLPPTPQEVAAFVHDSTPDAYETLVDRLLESPHFGERWGRHWLDKARYADSDGYEKDRPRPDAWRWRDWLIEAINRDMPFDQFTIEQQAGDLLPNADADQILATAFHRQTLTNTEGGVDQEEFRVQAVFDRVETTGAIWLGLTVGCARCHSHKYDAISQREYYRLFAFLNNGNEVNDHSVPISDTELSRYQHEQAEHERSVAALQQTLEDQTKALLPELNDWEQEIQAELSMARETPPRLHPLQDVSVNSTGKVEFEQLDDGSLLATGANPAKATYTLTARTDVKDIRGFRLDVLADERLPGKGPGRVGHGNFVLHEFQVEVDTSPEFPAPTKVEFSGARADFSQKGFDAERAVDGSLKTGWAISPQMGKDHWIQFGIRQPLDNPGSLYLRVTFRQEHGQEHTLGRFRLQAVTGIRPDELVPQEVADVLAVASTERSETHSTTLLNYFAGLKPEVRKLQDDLKKLKSNGPKSPYLKVRVIREEPRTTYLLRRGDFLQPQTEDEILPGTLEVLPELKSVSEDQQPNRLDLARWLVSGDNPLPPRVTANEIWSHLFGYGLVRSLNDFGVRGDEPTHPALLDWLADAFVRSNWSRKALIKQIVMSATYRQSSAHRPELDEIDPQNLLLARQNRFRVEAEIVRDLSLAAAGLLSKKFGGPSVFPPMPADVASLSYANNFKWVTSEGEDRYRRGMYTFFKRTAPHPNLTTFDCPDSNTACLVRNSSNTPLQALTTLNNEVFVEASQTLALRILHEPSHTTDRERLEFAFQVCLSRLPDERELDQFTELLSASREWYVEHPDEAALMAGSAGDEEAISLSDRAAWTATARILMNLDEFITRE